MTLLLKPADSVQSSWLADSTLIMAPLGAFWVMGSHAMDQILVSTHAPNFRIKWFYSKISPAPLLEVPGMPLLETKRTALGPPVLFYHFMFSVTHKLHGRAIPLPSSPTPRLHGCTVGSRVSGHNSPDVHKYLSNSTRKFQALTMLPSPPFFRALPVLLDPP